MCNPIRQQFWVKSVTCTKQHLHKNFTLNSQRSHTRRMENKKALDGICEETNKKMFVHIDRLNAVYDNKILQLNNQRRLVVQQLIQSCDNQYVR